MSEAEDALSEHLSLHGSQHFTNQVPKVGRLKEDIARAVAAMVHNIDKKRKGDRASHRIYPEIHLWD